MIALDPEFLGGFAPPSLHTEGTDQCTVSFARQTRLHRLRIQGKADETEDASEDESLKESSVGSGNPSKRDRAGHGKRKTRGTYSTTDPSTANRGLKTDSTKRPSALDRFHRRP